MEMDRVGKIIADHMVMSKNVSPHVTTVVEVDVTKLVQWRSRNKEAFRKREGISLTYMPAITEATAKALSEFPQGKRLRQRLPNHSEETYQCRNRSLAG